MTLHWWMHWFWVTSHLTGIIFALPLAQSTLQPEGTLFDREGNYTTFLTPTTETTTVSDDIAKLRDLFAQHHDKMYRIPKAIESNLQDDAPSPFIEEEAKQPLTNNRSWTTNENVNISITTTNNMTVNDSSDSPSNKSRNSNGNDNYDNRNDSGNINKAKIIFGEVFADRINNNKNKTTHRASQADSQITWITTSNATVESKPVERTTERSRITSDKLAVLPLRNARFKQASNKTTAIPSKHSKGPTLNETKEIDVGVDDVNGDFRVVVTASSVLQGMSESSRLSRAWSAFGDGVYRHDQQETQEQRQDVQTFDTLTNGTSSAIDIAAVTGSCLATVLLLGTMGSLGFVMYRKRYLNPPQTLNSDKCSNPDSSGYIDDSTIRDNSEEMYSLDNDSFLNSLEAMTIPNYWTDSVKHTKL